MSFANQRDGASQPLRGGQAARPNQQPQWGSNQPPQQARAAPRAGGGYQCTHRVVHVCIVDSGWACHCGCVSCVDALAKNNYVINFFSVLFCYSPSYSSLARTDALAADGDSDFKQLSQKISSNIFSMNSNGAIEPALSFMLSLISIAFAQA